MSTPSAITASMYVGDCLDGLRAMPDQFVHCCVTSPPYYGLRDYGTAIWVGGAQECDHGVRMWEGRKQTQGAQSGHAATSDRLNRMQCPCGAVRVDRQIGLEDTPDAYVARLVEVFREVRRVLRDDGTLWLNIADSYAGSCKGAWKNKDAPKETYSPDYESPQLQMARVFPGIKPKDLIGIPWMLAFALRADGWYLRQDIIWAKPNCMPESVRDRCTKSHEYVFLLTKSPRYYYDADAVKETVAASTIERLSQPTLNRQRGSSRIPGKSNGTMKAVGATDTRNRRSVWNVATAKFDGAHFAVFPPALVEPCVLAGCPTGGVVLDPFSGTGTTGEVAVAMGRSFVGCELNPEYAGMARERIFVALQGAKERPLSLLGGLA